MPNPHALVHHVLDELFLFRKDQDVKSACGVEFYNSANLNQPRLN